MAKAKLTIVEVAADAGVSLGTASRALSGHPAVRDDTRKRVQASARRMGYVPNRMARSLRSGSSMFDRRDRSRHRPRVLRPGDQGDAGRSRGRRLPDPGDEHRAPSRARAGRREVAARARRRGDPDGQLGGCLGGAVGAHRVLRQPGARPWLRERGAGQQGRYRGAGRPPGGFPRLPAHCLSRRAAGAHVRHRAARGLPERWGVARCPCRPS